MFDIKNVKHLRLLARMTQYELAKIAGVSQSLIAKIEAGHADPAYSSILKIEQALTTALHKEEPTAETFMTRKIISVSGNVTGKDIATILTKNNISQLPIIEHDVVIGIVTETDLLDPTANDKKVKDLTKDTPPIIPAHTPLSTLTSLLKQYPLILITKQGKIQGLITKADIIETMAHSKLS